MPRGEGGKLNVNRRSEKQAKEIKSNKEYLLNNDNGVAAATLCCFPLSPNIFSETRYALNSKLCGQKELSILFCS